MGPIHLRKSVDRASLCRESLRYLKAKPRTHNQVLARQVLQDELARIDSARDAIDTKALAIPLAVGAIGGLTVGHIDLRPDGPWYVLALVLLTAAAAFASVLLALAAIWAKSYALGPDPKDLITQADLDDVDYTQRTLIELGVAATLAARVVNEKGNRLNAALLAASIATISLLTLLFMGGKA